MWVGSVRNQQQDGVVVHVADEMLQKGVARPVVGVGVGAGFERLSKGVRVVVADGADELLVERILFRGGRMDGVVHCASG